jgi:protein TonB
MLSQQILFLEEVHAIPLSKRRILFLPPRVDPSHDVFAEAMLQEDSMHQRRNPWDWAASVVAHVAVLALLLILPLYFTSGLDMQRFNLTFLVAPLPPAAAPPPPIVSSAASRAVRAVPTRAYIAGKLTAPSFIPKTIVRTPGEIAPPDEVAMGVPGGVPGGMPGGQVGGVIGGILGGAMNSVRAPAAPVAEGPKEPLRVGGNVKQPRLIYGPAPEYPVLAKQSHISGIVVIEAIIDENGNVTEMSAVSGHPLLIAAALKAVSQHKYEPTYLDGEPTPIRLVVKITFRDR